MLVLLFLVAAGAVAALGYFGGWFGPKKTSQLSDDEILSRALQMLPEIKSGSVRFDIGFKSEPRDEGAKPITDEIPGLEERRKARNRDGERLQDIQRLMSSLRVRSRSSTSPSASTGVQPSYPQTLDEFVLDPETRTDPSGGSYRYSSSGSDFSLAFRLETSSAVASWNKQLDGTRTYGSTTAAPPRAVVNQDITLTAAHETPYVYLGSDGLDPLAMFDSDSLDMYQWLPSDLDTSFNIWSDFQAPSADGKPSNASAGLGAKVAMGAFTFAGSGEVRKVGEVMYGRVNEFPALGFFDLNAIKGKWVAMTEEDLIGSGLAVNFAEVKEEVSKENATAVKQYQLAIALAREQGVLSIEQVLPMTEENGVRYHHYRLKFDRTKFVGYYQALAERSKAEFGNDAVVKFSQEVVDYLQNEDFALAYDALAKNTAAEVWVQEKTYLPRQLAFSVRLVPPDAAIKHAGKQFKLKTSVTLDKVNQPVSVEAPSPTISVDEATGLVTGQSPAQIVLQRQIRNVEAIRTALRKYRQHAGAYPETLTDLKRKPSEVPRATPTPKPARGSLQETVNIGLQYGTVVGFGGTEDWEEPSTKNDAPFLKVIPNDVYTKQPYPYQRDGEGYTVKYQVQLVKDENSERSPWSSYAQYVEGENTADQSSLSREQETTEDSDHDGLSDRQERDVYGTSPYDDDTDNDGFKDGVEVRGGYNPKGDGRLQTGQTQPETSLSGGTTSVTMRDRQRVSDMKQLQTALEIYFNDKGAYPPESGDGEIGNPTNGFGCLGDLGWEQDNMCASPIYMGLTPHDPSTTVANPGNDNPCKTEGVLPCNYSYNQLSGNTYEIHFRLEANTGGLSSGLNCASEAGTSSKGCVH